MRFEKLNERQEREHRAYNETKLKRMQTNMEFEGINTYNYASVQTQHGLNSNGGIQPLNSYSPTEPGSSFGCINLCRDNANNQYYDSP